MVKRLVQTFNNLDDGKYAIVKLPYKPHIKIFRIPEENNKDDNDQWF